MDTDNKTELRTFRFRVKDKQSGKWLDAAARGIIATARRFTRSITSQVARRR